MKEIKVKNSRKSALVDDDCFSLLSRHQWSLDNDGYARAVIGSRHFRMHELVIVRLPFKVIDHINYNRIDNRRENLQLLTNSENLLRNKSRDRKDLGVGFHGLSGKWRARLISNSKEIYLGLFTSKQKAINARNAALKGLKCTQNI
jgi:HNH endonuclease